jgi:hypothetical protein
MIRNLLFDLFDFILVWLQPWMPDQVQHDKLESDPNYCPNYCPFF